MGCWGVLQGRSGRGDEDKKKFQPMPGNEPKKYYPTAIKMDVLHISLRWVGHVAYMGADEKCIDLWYEDLAGRDHLEDVGLCGMIILKRNLEKQNRWAWTGFMWHRVGISGSDCCEHDNETSGSIKGGEFLDKLSDY
jgi:hypothetical protein